MISKILNWLVEDKPMPTMNREQEIGMFSQLWQNPTFRQYINARERYLKDQSIEDFIQGKLKSAEGLAGQFIEIRNLRIRARAAYLVISNRKAQKKK